MNKAKTIKKKSKIWLIVAVIVAVLLLAVGVVLILTQNGNRYVGTYNYDNRNSITLKQDGTCDFAERGESGYSDNILECTYAVKDEVVYFDRDVKNVRLETSGYTEEISQCVGPDCTCERYRGKGLIEYCKEEIVRIQETAAIGETGMIYKDKNYIKLK
jgi:hypothetical protein